MRLQRCLAETGRGAACSACWPGWRPAQWQRSPGATARTLNPTHVETSAAPARPGRCSPATAGLSAARCLMAWRVAPAFARCRRIVAGRAAITARCAVTSVGGTAPARRAAPDTAMTWGTAVRLAAPDLAALARRAPTCRATPGCPAALPTPACREHREPASTAAPIRAMASAARRLAPRSSSPGRPRQPGVQQRRRAVMDSRAARMLPRAGANGAGGSRDCKGAEHGSEAF